MRKYILLLSSLICLSFIACEKDKAPDYYDNFNCTITNVSVSATSAEIEGRYDYETELESIHILYSRYTDLSDYKSKKLSLNGNHFNGTINDLSPNTNYYYCLECNSGINTIRTINKSFKTESGGFMEKWFYYDDGENVDAIGLESGGSFSWGIMIPSSNLQSYGGCALTKVSMYVYEGEAHTGTIKIYTGGSDSPQTLVHTQTYSATKEGEFQTFTLDKAISLDTSKNLWIIFKNDNGHYVASACDNTGNSNGRWLYLNSEWQDITTLGLDYTWMLRAYVTNVYKEDIPIEPLEDDLKPTYGTISTASGN